MIELSAFFDQALNVVFQYQVVCLIHAFYKVRVEVYAHDLPFFYEGEVFWKHESLFSKFEGECNIGIDDGPATVYARLIGKKPWRDIYRYHFCILIVDVFDDLPDETGHRLWQARTENSINNPVAVKGFRQIFKPADLVDLDLFLVPEVIKVCIEIVGWFIRVP